MQIKQLDPHGMIAEAINELGLVEKIDQAIPKTRAHRVTVGEAVKAMILIGLGYTDRPLYIVEEIMRTMSVGELFGKGHKAEDFTDDVLGRSLDKIYETDPTGLLIDLVNEMIQTIPKRKRQQLNFDTTTYREDGQYKNKHFDLKQFILALCVNQDALNLLMKNASRSASDKNAIVDTVNRLKDNLILEQDPLYIAYSDFYTAKNVEMMGQDNKFLTRAPATLKIIRELAQAELTLEQSPNPNYHYCEIAGEYAGVKVKYIVVHSKELQETKEKSIKRRLEKEEAKAAKSFKKLCRQTYYCEADAQEQINQWEKEHPLFRVETIRYLPQTIKKTPRRGRPAKTEETQTIYHIEGTWAYNPQTVQKYTHNLGQFVLVSNDTQMSPEEALILYKEQSRAEIGFRFLKDPTFRISKIPLNKTQRKQALLMVMVLTLFVYNYLERKSK